MSAAVKVLRYDVPVDGQAHRIEAGRPVHVDCRQPDVVTFWAEGPHVVSRTFRVFATGEALPAGETWGHVGTALSPCGPAPHCERGALVWHLFVRTSR